MSKYDALWRSIQDSGTKELTLTFDQIEDLAGVPLDHSFLRYKKELIEYGREVDGISRKAQTVTLSVAGLSAKAQKLQVAFGPAPEITPDGKLSFTFKPLEQTLLRLTGK